MSKATWLATVVLAMWAGPAAAQTVTGTAVDLSVPRNAVVGVTVQAFDQAGNPASAPGRTRAGGAFNLTVVGNPQSITLRFSGADENGTLRATTTVTSLNPESGQNLSVVVPEASQTGGCCPTYPAVTSTPACGHCGLFRRRR